jgi:NADH-quinone oxidoreductase subunit L
MIDLVWLIPFFPLLGVVLNGFFGKKYIKHKAGHLASAMVGLSFAVALPIFFEVVGGKTLNWDMYTWIPAGSFNVTVGFLVDPLSAVMLMVVAGIGFLIHVYSIGYMHDDPGYYRYFAYLNLFTFSMLMLVLSNNYLLLYVFWEAVGLCSYLLIGFWFEKKSAADAGKKAFLVNRVGDFGFGLGVMFIWTTLGTLQYSEVFNQAPAAYQAGGWVITTITLLLFMGAAGKSAQIPLYVWLPDAMEGPTPVSALIHAATMVTAGVYMVARSNVLFTMAPISMQVVAYVGAATALFAATIGLVQNDIKRVLAYSTVSQLGYMFAGLGVGAYAAGIFHLTTHAFFKALLFLGSGSVIHAMGGEQDIRKMGALRHHMPRTYMTFLIACLAIAGFPFLSGFFSKDEILWGAFHSHNYIVYGMLATGAFMTAFYMFRLYFLTFCGKSRVDHEVRHHLHESPGSMTWPLMILAFFAAVVGWVGFPPEAGFYHKLVEPIFQPAAHGVVAEGAHGAAAAAAADHALEYIMMGVSVAIGLAGIGLAYYLYLVRTDLPDKIQAKFQGLYTLILNKYYIDELYSFLFIQPCIKLCEWFFAFDAWVVDGIVNASAWLTVKLSDASYWHDLKIVDGTVNGVGWVIEGGSRVFRRAQTGQVQNYAWAMAAGVFVLVMLFLFL